MSYLHDLVVQKIRAFSQVEEAAEFFGISPALVKQWESGSKPISLAAVEKVFDVNAVPGVAKREEAMWEGKSCVILQPSYKQTNPRTAFCLLSLIDRQKCAAMLDFGDAFISHSRNKLADNFLKTGIEWSFWCDDDMVIPMGQAKLFNTFTRWSLPDQFAGMHSINRLMSHGKTLVGGLYFGRWAHGKPVYAEGQVDAQEELYARRAPMDVCKPTKWVGTGCLLVHRSVYLDIETKFPHLARNKDGDFGHWFSSDPHDLKQATSLALGVLNDEAVSVEARILEARRVLEQGKALARHHSSLGMGEDVAFGTRAGQAGHQSYIDLGLLCGHVGEYVFGPKKLT